MLDCFFGGDFHLLTVSTQPQALTVTKRTEDVNQLSQFMKYEQDCVFIPCSLLSVFFLGKIFKHNMITRC